MTYQPAELRDPELIKTFTLAGKAILTLQSLKTGHHFTYQVTKCKKDAARFWVSVLGDRDRYFTIGAMIDHGTKFNGKSEQPPSVKAFTYFWDGVLANQLRSQLKVLHEGRCGLCRRALTNPLSLSRGIGPECLERTSLTCI